jgi:two-component sensor histidine kinase
VSDNGVGLPAGMDWRQSPSLGLHLLHMLATQVRGKVDLSVDQGTAFLITFVPPKPKLAKEDTYV